MNSHKSDLISERLRPASIRAFALQSRPSYYQKVGSYAEIISRILAVSLLFGSLRADPVSNQEFLVVTGQTKETIAAITELFNKNKIAFSTDQLVGQGENFEVIGETSAQNAFSLIKALKTKFSKNDLVIPDKIIGRTVRDDCAIGLTYSSETFNRMSAAAEADKMPQILEEGDSMTGFALTCKKEDALKAIRFLRSFAKQNPKLQIFVYIEPHKMYEYDEPVPTVDIILK